MALVLRFDSFIEIVVFGFDQLWFLAVIDGFRVVGFADVVAHVIFGGNLGFELVLFE